MHQHRPVMLQSQHTCCYPTQGFDFRILSMYPLFVIYPHIGSWSWRHWCPVFVSSYSCGTALPPCSWRLVIFTLFYFAARHFLVLPHNSSYNCVVSHIMHVLYHDSIQLYVRHTCIVFIYLLPTIPYGQVRFQHNTWLWHQSSYSLSINGYASSFLQVTFDVFFILLVIFFFNSSCQSSYVSCQSNIHRATHYLRSWPFPQDSVNVRDAPRTGA